MFEEDRIKRIASFKSNEELIKSSRETTSKAMRNGYSYNFEWLGFKIIQFPEDILNFQQIIFKEKWDPVATADAHFKRFQPVDSKLPVTDDGPPVIEGLNGNITREELEVLSRIRNDRAIGGDSTKLSTARPSDFSSFDF